MSLGKKIASNTIISSAGRIVSSVLGFISIAFMSRYLGTGGFGDYNIVLVYLYIVVAVSDLGLYSILSREISKPGSNESSLISNIFGLRIFSILAFFIVSFAVLWFLPYSWMVKTGILIASPGFLFLSTNQILMGVFQKHLKTIWPVIGDFVTRAIQLTLIILFIDLKLDFLFFVLAMSASSLIGFFVNLYFAKRLVKFSLSFKWNFSKEILKKSWPLAVSSVLTLIYFKMDSFMLSLMKPSADVGIYSAAYKVFEGLLFFPAAFSGLMLPLMANVAEGQMDKFKMYYKKAMDFLVIITLPIVAGGIILSDKIALLIGGEEFLAASLPIKILMGALFFVFLGNLFGNVIIALDKQKKMVYVYGAGVIISTVFNLIFIPRFSYMATSMATLLTEMAVNSALFFIILREIKYWPFDSRFIKVLFSSLIMAGALQFFTDWNLLVLVIFGAIIYSATLLMIRGISKKEITVFLSRKQPSPNLVPMDGAI